MRELVSLCSLCVLCVSVVIFPRHSLNTEDTEIAQRGACEPTFHAKSSKHQLATINFNRFAHHVTGGI